MVLENNLSLVKKVNRLLNWGHWFCFFNILLALGVTSVYWLSEPLPATLLGQLYLLLNWIGHTAFLCFLFFILTIFPVSLIFPYQRHVRGLAAVLATCALVVLIFDAYVYAHLGYHIGSASFEQAIDLLRQQIVTNLRNFVLIVLTVGVILLALQLTLSNYCWKKVERLKQTGIGSMALAAFIGSFSLSHLIHIYADANLNYDVTRQDNVLPLSYPATAKTLLARYQLVDLNRRAQLQLDKLNLPASTGSTSELYCEASRQGAPTVVIISALLNEQHSAVVQNLKLKALELHFAPVQQSEALLNLVYSTFNTEHQQTLDSLQSAPGWLNQTTAQGISISRQSTTELPQLPWLAIDKPAQFAIVFDNNPQQHINLYQQYTNVLLLQLSASAAQFRLAPVPAWSNWEALHQLQPHSVTQHLDIVPTLLAQAGCNDHASWLGDNLQKPLRLPKLTISGDEIISFKKDKMLILRSDGSYGVWSAGTLLPLNEKLDQPMLIDALKRIDTSTVTPP
jgi:membrane-anchored protein YejM (alkaline phosphatase superfamily)